MASFIINYLLIAAVSFLFVLVVMPQVIRVAQQWELFDDHSLSRKDHGYGIPRLGGVAVFISLLLTSLFLIAKEATNLPMYELYAAGIIMFMAGLKDDLLGMRCRSKFAVQAIVSLIVTVPGNIRITNLYGIFSIHQLSYLESVIFSAFIIMFIINSFNLIDGIDGLAGTLGVIACGAFAYYFMLAGEVSLAKLALSAAAALIAFLGYNYSPSKIFMGDSGSLLLGLMCAVFAIKFIAINEVSSLHSIHAAPAFAVAILIVPTFDTLSVIAIRIANRKSPFKPDRNHIHHRLLRLGLNHIQTTSILAVVAVIFIALAFIFKEADNQLLLMLFAGLFIVLNAFITLILRLKTKQTYPVSNLIS
jgi:UDP-GlcNAc:undecaprenyl-phosphate GlcNAc-1-phosphate transferase